MGFALEAQETGDAIADTKSDRPPPLTSLSPPPLAIAAEHRRDGRENIGVGLRSGPTYSGQRISGPMGDGQLAKQPFGRSSPTDGSGDGLRSIPTDGSGDGMRSIPIGVGNDRVGGTDFDSKNEQQTSVGAASPLPSPQLPSPQLPSPQLLSLPLLSPQLLSPQLPSLPLLSPQLLSPQLPSPPCSPVFSISAELCVSGEMCAPPFLSPDAPPPPPPPPPLPQPGSADGFAPPEIAFSYSDVTLVTVAPPPPPPPGRDGNGIEATRVSVSPHDPDLGGVGVGDSGATAREDFYNGEGDGGGGGEGDGEGDASDGCGCADNGGDGEDDDDDDDDGKSAQTDERDWRVRLRGEPEDPPPAGPLHWPPLTAVELAQQLEAERCVSAALRTQLADALADLKVARELSMTSALGFLYKDGDGRGGQRAKPPNERSVPARGGSGGGGGGGGGGGDESS
jgi:hypothetical protein